MRSKPQVPEASQALERRLKAVQEMIAEDQEVKAVEQAKAVEAAPAPPPPPATPATTVPSVAEYAFPEEEPILGHYQLSVRIPADLQREITAYLMSTRGRVKKNQLVWMAVRMYLDAAKGKGNGSNH